MNGVGQSRSWRAAVAVCAVGSGASALVVWLVRRYGWTEASAIVTVAALPTGVLGTYLTLEARFRSSSGGAVGGPADLVGVAELLAVAVRRQWEAEAELHRLNEPYALPVRWRPASPGLVEDWRALIRLATIGGAGWPTPPAGGWAAGPAGLAGEGNDLVEVLDRVPTGRLVVLGEPGAGKTILLVRLVLGLLARRSSGWPVPVLVSLVSWDPTGQRLYDWLATRLTADYPALAEPAPGGGRCRARAVLDDGLVVPVLDGLDEIPNALRSVAIARINEALRPGQRLVVAARSQPYREAVSSVGGVELRLTGAAGIELCPLEAADVADYLRDSAGGLVGAARWDPVVAVLAEAPASPVAQALVTPLMAALARAVFNPRLGEQATAVPSRPADLLDQERFPSRAAVEEHLFDAFVPAAYRPHPDPARECPWRAADAERWLIFLARHLEHNLHGSPNFAWWRLPAAVSPRRSRLPQLATGLVAGLASGLTGGLVYWFACGPPYGLTHGFASGLTYGLGVGLSWGIKVPARAMRWHTRRGLTYGLVYGLVIGLATGLAYGLANSLAVGLTIGLTAALAGLAFGGFKTAPADLTTAAGPISALACDRATFRQQALAGGLAFGLAGGPLGGFVFGLTYGPAAGLAGGLVFGLALGVTVGFFRTASGTFALAHGWLAMRGRLPRRLIAFLDDAHQRRGVLRQVGAVYQFRHLELQRCLARR